MSTTTRPERTTPLPSPTVADSSRSKRRRSRNNRLTVLAFLSPWIIGFCLFMLYPMIASLYFSFTNYNLANQPRWVGLNNYQFMFTKDRTFWIAVRNTAFIVLLATPLKIVFALGVALVVSRVKRGASVYRTMLYLPAIVPVVAGALAFVFLLNPTGPLNRLLGFLHLPQPLWFSDPAWAKPGLTLLMIWVAGNTMVILLAGLLDVPKDLYEAASLDGAGPLRSFRNITLPMISPVLYFASLTGIIEGFQYFAQGYVVSKAVSGSASVLGAPENSLLFYSTTLYQQGYTYFHMGYASALSWVLFLTILVSALTLVWSSRRWVYYGGGGS